jgi:hypothetical protein
MCTLYLHSHIVLPVLFIVRKVYVYVFGQISPFQHPLPIHKHGQKWLLQHLKVNVLPSCIKIQHDNPKKFKLNLQKFLYDNSFSSLGEYCELFDFVVYITTCMYQSLSVMQFFVH